MTTREIDERIAAALERLADRTRAFNPGINHAAAWQAATEVAAELRAAERAPWPEQVSHEVPASEPSWKCPSCTFWCANPEHHHADCEGRFPVDGVHPEPAPLSARIERERGMHLPPPTPPPSLVERARCTAEFAQPSVIRAMLDQLADALEAAQAEAFSYRVNFAPYVDRAQKSLTSPSSLGQSVLKAALDELEAAQADTRRLDALCARIGEIADQIDSWELPWSTNNAARRVPYLSRALHEMTARIELAATMERKP